jgi:nitrite reductase/ring-hydroxylating ferredoxin subunit
MSTNNLFPEKEQDMIRGWLKSHKCPHNGGTLNKISIYENNVSVLYTCECCFCNEKIEIMDGEILCEDE